MSESFDQCCGTCIFSDDVSEEVVFCYVSNLKINKGFPACDKYKEDAEPEDWWEMVRQ